MKAIYPDRRINSSSVALLLLASSLIAAFVLAPQRASAASPSILNNSNCGGTNISISILCNLTVTNTGDTLILSAAGIRQSGGAGSQVWHITSVTDTQGNLWASRVTTSYSDPLGCTLAYCADAEIWTATSLGSGLDTINVTVSTASSIKDDNWFFDVSGITKTPIGTATGSCVVSASCTETTMGTVLSNTFVASKSLNIAAITYSRSITGVTAGSGYSLFYFSPTVSAWGEYSLSAASPTVYPWSSSFGSTNSYMEAGATFGPSLFTCSISNMDGGNYVVAGANKFYNFNCAVNTLGIPGAPSNAYFTDMKVRFNDSNTGSCTITCFSPNFPNIVVLEYSNTTKQASIDQGGGISSLGTPTVSQSLSNGIRTLNVTFPVMLNTDAQNAVNRGIELYAELNSSASRGFEYVQRNYFNVITAGGGGGAVSKLQIAGLCSVPSGADVFQTICKYGANSHNWIAENATYYQLQQYQAQYSIQLMDPFGNPSPYYWQIFNETGAGCHATTCPSENSGDWKVDWGLYHWDSTSSTCCWVKGIHVVLQTVMGRVGSANLWTKFAAAWYDGSTLVANQTFHAFVPDDGGQGTNGQLGPSQVQLWVNLWYSQNNGSTEQGGQVSAYYTGMHTTNYLIWQSSWSPFQGNATNSQVFMPLKDHSGLLMPAQQATMSKVYMNMSRPGAPGINSGQDNFEIMTTNFQEQEFNTAAGSSMTGIATPTFAVAVIPTIQSNSIFSPIVNALKALAGWIAKGFAALGTQIWNALGAQFPWFTNFWSGVASALQAFFSLFEDVITNLVSFLITLAGWFSQLFTPILNTITGAWTQVNSLLTWTKYIPTQDIGPTVEVFIIIVFGLSVMEALFTNDWPYIIKLVQGGWHVTEAIMTWTWRLAKFVVDVITGLIP